MEDDAKENSSEIERLLVGIILVALLVAGVFLFAPNEAPDESRREEPTDFSNFRPHERLQDGYAGSDSCRECHASEHESWFASYHRKMTQVADAGSVIGNFDSTVYRFPGKDGTKQFSPRKADGQFWVELDSTEDYGQPGERHTLPVVMTTGSHHMQAYWVSIGRERTIGLFPLVYLREDQRWVPRKSAFLKPPTEEFSMEMARWDMTCIRCHTTGSHPEEKLVDGNRVFDSSAAEFGISCEACHGKAEEHVHLRRRERAGDQTPIKDPIINPRELTHQRSAQVCGACHAFIDYADPHYHHSPGMDLLTNGVHLLRDNQSTRDYIARINPDLKGPEQAAVVDAMVKGYFWPDGHVRVVGREYSALMQSRCHSEGQASCVSCHRLHKSKTDPRPFNEWADDLLRTGMRSDQACLQCHEAATFATSKHTHHTTGSSGSKCMNCHMPNTAYGLLKATRDHTVFSPNITKDQKAGRPNACNLCHLDQSVAWSAKHLNEWYEQEIPDLEPQWTNTAASVVWTLRGDAHVRALAAWHFGWQPAHSAVESVEWIPPMLAALMNDPYDAVRYIAHKSLRSLPAFQKLEFDYVGPIEERAEGIENVLRTWQQNSQIKERRDLLIDENGGLDQSQFNRHLKARDDRPVHLLE